MQCMRPLLAKQVEMGEGFTNSAVTVGVAGLGRRHRLWLESFSAGTCLSVWCRVLCGMQDEALMLQSKWGICTHSWPHTCRATGPINAKRMPLSKRQMSGLDGQTRIQEDTLQCINNSSGLHVCKVSGSRAWTARQPPSRQQTSRHERPQPGVPGRTKCQHTEMCPNNCMQCDSTRGRGCTICLG